jgi:hypothetical protein
MQAKQTRLTELEDRLARADGEALRLQLLRDLQGLEARLAAQMARMVPKEEFAQLAASVEAVRAARKVVREWVPCTAQIPSRLQ